MIEIIQIVLIYLAFSISIFLPINLFSINSSLKKYTCIDLATFNLGINLSVLLIFSLLNYSIKTIQPFIFSFYLILLIFTYCKNIKQLLKTFTKYIPIFLVFFILSMDIANKLYLGWDAKFFYYIKSLYFFENKNLIDLTEFSAHRYHPHLGSYIWAFFRKISIIDFEYTGRLYYLFIFCFSVFYLIDSKKNSLINYFFYFLIVVLFYEYEFFSGLQEILLFSILLIISKYLFKITQYNNDLFLYFLVIFANLMMWIKLEGIVYLLILSLITNFSLKIRFKKKLMLTIMFLSIYCMKLIVYYVSDLNLDAQPSYNSEYLTSLTFSLIIEKIKSITIWLLYYAFNNVFFISGLFIVLLTNFTKNNYTYLKIVSLYLILFICFIYFAYIIRDQEIIYAIRTTMDRLIMTSSGFFVYLILIEINKIFKNKILKL